MKENKKPRTGNKPPKVHKDCQEGRTNRREEKGPLQRTKSISSQSWDLKPTVLSSTSATAQVPPPLAVQSRTEEHDGLLPLPLTAPTPVPEIAGEGVNFTAAMAAFIFKQRKKKSVLSKRKLHTLQEGLRIRNCVKACHQTTSYPFVFLHTVTFPDFPPWRCQRPLCLIHHTGSTASDREGTQDFFFPLCSVLKAY